MSENTPKVFIISDSPNATVVQLGNRKFLGLVIQGDTLNNISHLLTECASCIDSNDIKEAGDIIEELKSILSGLNDEYKRVVAF